MFFPKYINIPDIKSRFLRNRIQLLKDIVKGSLINIPFQNVTSFGVPRPGPKPIPSYKALLDSTLRGHGGMCGHNNYSLKVLLQSIGFDTYNAAAKFRRTLVEGSHVVCLVKIPPPFSVDQETEDVYLVDVGCGVPILEPIRLKDLPYKGRAGGFDFSYELSPDDGKIINRIHKGGDPFVGQKPKDYLCPQDYTINLEPRTIASIIPSWGQVYGEPDKSSFQSTFYIFRYVYIAPDNSDFKIACIRGKELLLITRESRTVQRFSSYEDLLPSIHEYFPQLLQHEVLQAMSNFNAIDQERKN
ncbi:unnamed protein product [Allacma fusca]|uniref:Arylamine N-acetyltransferase n=1 Tax=Allacma fusca TaxID=39272 RepID=A0A8J2LGI3_9HEXA|nr:unnamed protein product [Allacma fusca]